MSLRACLVACLILLQGADVVMTWRLLTTSEDVIEANPVARAILERHGWAGAVALKLACTSVALGCVLAIAQTRPVFSQGLLAGLCGLMLSVVGYSAALLARPGDPDDGRMADSRDASPAPAGPLASLSELGRKWDALCAGLPTERPRPAQAARPMPRRGPRVAASPTPLNRAASPEIGHPVLAAMPQPVNCGNACAARAAPDGMSVPHAKLARHQEARPSVARAQPLPRAALAR